MNRFSRYLPLIALCLVAACGDKDDDTAAKAPASPESLYNDARALIDEKNYKEAAKAFDEVDRQHPSSPWAQHAQVMSGYASFRADDYDTATRTLERFVKLYPGDESTPYAYYLIAVSYYKQISDVGRDQKATQDALQALREVVRRFPDTDYARDAKIKIDLAVDHLAGKEMQVGRYYLVREDYLAAINRFRAVVDQYQTTNHTPEALHRLVECYLRLGVREEAQKYAAVLGHNFPDSLWYRDSYKLLAGQSAKPLEEEKAPWWDVLVP